MTVDQMLWHLNQSLRMPVGDVSFGPMRRVPAWLKPAMRWMLLNAPWPKGRAPTYDEMRARAGTIYDFSAERDQLVALIARVAAMPLDGEWPLNPTLGPMTGEQWSQLQARHVDHHLRQFGV
jgi:hypothetical protein